MSNVWGMRHRVLCEQLEELARKLGDAEPISPEVLEELVVRLLTPVVMLLRKHAVNKRGQCKFCRRTRWTWWFWRRQRRCTVFRVLDLVMGQDLDVVWWQLFASVGDEVSLAEVREWFGERANGR
ncbi:MAG: hypothetical protein ACREX8_10700 [Gammaproteobacteria bacterium]